MTLPLTAPNKPRLNSVFQRLMSIHWWMAIAYLAVFSLGILMPRWPDVIPFRDAAYDVHKSLGVLTMALLLWRIVTLIQVISKKYSKRFPRLSRQWIQNVALHTSLYGFMVAVPLAGFFLSNSYKANNVSFFGILLPDLFPQNNAMIELGRTLHFWLAYTFLATIVVHMISQQKVVKANWRRFLGVIKTRRSS